MKKNPFQKAEPSGAKLKLMLYGPAGAGKTRLAVATACALAAKEEKRTAVISLEGGVEYLPAAGFDFDTLPTASYQDVMEALEYLLSDAGRAEYAAIVIDPATVIYHVVQEAQQDIVERRAVRKRRDPGEESLGFREWGQVKTQMDKLATRLVSTCQHVLVTAREGTEYEQKGSQLTAVGTKPECHKSWPYLFDVVARVAFTGSDRKLHVEKDRFGLVGKAGETVDAPDFIDFTAAEAGARSLIDVSAAAAVEADAEEPRAATAETVQLIEATIEAVDDVTAAKTREWLEQRRDTLSQRKAEELLNSLQEKAKAA